MPNGRCKFHGGASLSGPAHPNWKGGRHSKYMPKNLLDRYQHAEQDPHLISLRAEVVLVDVRISQLLETIGEHGGTSALKAIRARLQEFKDCGRKGDKALGSARLALQKLEDEIDAAMTAALTWDELRETIDLRRKLTETETKQLKDLQQMISIAQMTAAMGRLLEAVTRHVADPITLRAVHQEFLRLVGRPGDENPGGDDR